MSGSAAQSLDFARIADSYDETRGGEDRGRRFAAELNPMLDPSRPVLELGIGTGLIALGLTELGHSLFGVDISEAMTRKARTRIGSRVAVADARAIPLGPEHVQKIIYEMNEANLRRMQASATGPGSIADELAKLDRLRDEGLLSDAEFESEKARLLGRG